MNKRKPDDEFAQIDLSYFNAGGEEVVVFCPESKDAGATQHPARRRLRSVEEQQAPEVETAQTPHPRRYEESRPLSVTSSAGHEPTAYRYCDGRAQRAAFHDFVR